MLRSLALIGSELEYGISTKREREHAQRGLDAPSVGLARCSAYIPSCIWVCRLYQSDHSSLAGMDECGAQHLLSALIKKVRIDALRELLRYFDNRLERYNLMRRVTYRKLEVQVPWIRGERLRARMCECPDLSEVGHCGCLNERQHLCVCLQISAVCVLEI